MRGKTLPTLYLLAILALAAALLFAAAAQKSFWEDEAFTAIFAQKDTSELLEGLSWDVHPPLYLLLVNQWGKVFGFDELGLRSFSILWSLAALLLAYKLARDLIGEPAALLALTLLALNPLLLMYGFNARYYAMAVFMSLALAWAALRFQRPGQLGFLLLYLLSSVAFLYLLFAAFVVIAAANLWWLARWLVQKQERSAGALALWLAAQAAVVGLYWPGLQILQTVGGRFGELAQVSSWPLEIAKRAGYYAFVSAVGETLSPLNPLAWIGGLVFAGLLIYALAKNLRSLNFWLPASFGLLIAIVNLLLTFNVAVSQTWQNLTYRALYLYPFLMIWLAVGLVGLKPAWRSGLGAALLLAFCLANVNYFMNRQFLRPLYTVPWKSIVQQVQAEMAPGGLAVCGYGDSSCYYYLGKAGLGQNDLNNWANLSKSSYPEVWYIQTNLGRGEFYGDLPALQQTFLDEMAGRYSLSEQTNFAPQDPGIRSLKNRFLGQEDYEYRVYLYRFFTP